MSAGDTTPSLFPGADTPAPRETPRPGAEPTGAAARAPAPVTQGVGKTGNKRGGNGKAAKSPAKGAVSPMMQQYYRAKKDAGDALLFFRMGDFYELFHEDAKVASRVLGITLTARSKGEGAIPMAGVPVKAYEGYVQQLIREGFRVAVCDQVTDPKTTKGLVDRRVTRIVTAGTVFEDDLLERGASNFLLAVSPAGDRCGLAWLDVSTGEFRLADVEACRVVDEISRLDPAEIVLPESLLERPDEGLAAALRDTLGTALVAGAEWTFDHGTATDLLTEQLGVTSLAGFGVPGEALGIRAAGGALAYLRETQRGELTPLSSVALYDPGASAGLDRATRATLEVLETQRDRRKEGSLLGVVDRTATAMGARLLRQWLTAPLVDPEAIGRRQAAVAELVDHGAVRDALGDALSDLPDLERSATRLLAGRGSPRDLAAIRTTLRAVPRLREALASCQSEALARTGESLDPVPEVLDLLERSLADPPAPVLAEGGVIAPGWHDELDELRTLRENGAAAIARFQAEEIARSGIDGLKVGYNRVFGYYVEITHAQAAGVTLPDDYVRKQTLTSAERYITPQLKELESSILNAEDRSKTLEARLFAELPCGSWPGPSPPSTCCAASPASPPSRAGCAQTWTTATCSTSRTAATRWWRACCPPVSSSPTTPASTTTPPG
jgi:DNA mismatch repair protein MutS